jgi:hypothetical protein
MIQHSTPYGDMIQRLEEKLLTFGYALDLHLWTIEMDPKMRTKGGLCRVSFLQHTVKISLNETLFKSLSDEERWNILSHEAAHGVCFKTGAWKDGHGPIWKVWHRRLGGSAERTHDHEVKHNLVRRYVLLDRNRPGVHYSVSSQKAKKYINWNAARFTLVGITICDRNSMTWRWEKLYDPSMREAAIFTKLRRIE